MITNLHYDKKHQRIGVKSYGEKKVVFEPFSRIFFAKKGLIPPDPAGKYYVKDSEKKFYFTDEPVDIITCMVDSAYYELMAKYPKDQMYLTDLRPEYQYLLYGNKHLSEKYVKGFLDIETDDDLNAEEAKSPIFMITVMINSEIKVFNIREYDTEEAMLKDFFNWICDESFPDVLMGWNVIDYDLTYIVSRADRLGVKYDFFKFGMIEFINMADILKKKFGYTILKDTGGMSLEAVSTYFLGQGKKKIPTTFGRFFKENMAEAVEYNLTDVVILEELDDKVLFFDFLKRIQEVSGVLIRDAFYNSIIIDVMLIKKYKDYVFPSKKVKGEYEVSDEEEYEGGYVIAPPKGIFNNVALLDFSAMYPSIILTFNISPDSKRAKADSDYMIDGVGFARAPFGIFKQTIGELHKKRLELKAETKKIEKKHGRDSLEFKTIDSVQAAYKTILNSVYGVCAFRGFRFYDVDLAKSITYMGRTLLLKVKEKVEEHKLGTVVYGDTDSFFIELKEKADIVVKRINKEFIPQYLEQTFNITTENHMDVEMKDVYERLVLFAKKKKYIAKEKDKPNSFVIKGLDTEKYDVPKKIRVFMKEIIIKLFDAQTIDLDEYKEKIKALPLADLRIIKRFNKKMEDYKSLPQHLRAFRWGKKYGILDEERDKSNLVKMVFVNVLEDLGYTYTDVAAIDDQLEVFPPGIDIDYEKYYQFFIIQKMEDLYDVFGVDYEGKKEKVEKLEKKLKKDENKKKCVPHYPAPANYENY